MKIAVDGMGGDYAPKEILEGIVLAIKELPADVKIIVVGKKTVLLPYLNKLDYPAHSLEIVDATEVIEMGEHPTRALTQKPNSSIGVGFRLLKENQVDAFCSAGNTGAMMVGALFSLKPIGNILRPALAGFFPMKNGKECLMLDIGANADCKPDMLKQFAILGSLYAKVIFEIENPRVALLNIGAEPEKGTMLLQATYQLLKNTPKLHFIGNIESRDLLNNAADVVVTDGFTGNMLFKLGESIYEHTQTVGIKDSLIERMNYEAVGGTPIIGINGNVIIGHGISSALAVRNMIFLAKKQIESNVISRITELYNSSR